MAVPTADAKANAEAVWPDGNDPDIGMRTQRSAGTVTPSRSGRRRGNTLLSAILLTADAMPTLTTPMTAAFRPRRPPKAARTPAVMSQILEWLAASDNRARFLSSDGVGTAAIDS